jgi:tRNA (guanine37-N1)-methyltransferase
LKHQIAIVTPVPEMVATVVQNSMLRQAVERQVVDIHLINLREFGEGNYRQIDDKPFGGGSGMVLMAGPLFKAIEAALDQIGGFDEGTRIIYPSPQGKPWSHQAAMETSAIEKLIVICGHYKGIDQRVIDKYVTHEYSIGDYVLTSGELPALVLLDSTVRLIPGVLNDYESAMTDSFVNGLLEGPYYTQPRELDGREVPPVLLSGHHQKIKAWRAKQQEQWTKVRRPDLWEKYTKKHESETKK